MPYLILRTCYSNLLIRIVQPSSNDVLLRTPTDYVNDAKLPTYDVHLVLRSPVPSDGGQSPLAFFGITILAMGLDKRVTLYPYTLWPVLERAVSDVFASSKLDETEKGGRVRNMGSR